MQLVFFYFRLLNLFNSYMIWQYCNYIYTYVYMYHMYMIMLVMLMCIDLGSFEIFHFWMMVIVLVAIIVIMLSIFSYKNILNSFGLRNFLRKDFYECGFKPVSQKPMQLSMQFFVLCIFFILYDIELIFSFPLVSMIFNQTFLEVIIFMFIYSSFILSLCFDIDRYLLLWYI